MLVTSNHPASVTALRSKAFPTLYRLHGRGRDSSLPFLDLRPKFSALPLVAPLPRHSKHVSGPGARAGARARVVAGEATVGRCTYGGGNSLWLTQELERLLSVQKRPGHGLVLTRGRWSWDLQNEDHYQLIGKLEFHNITEKFEIFVPEVEGKLQLLSGTSLSSISTAIQISPQHPQGKPAPREDGYWPAYIIPAGESTSIEVPSVSHHRGQGFGGSSHQIDKRLPRRLWKRGVSFDPGDDVKFLGQYTPGAYSVSVDILSSEGMPLTELQAARLEIEYISYGPHGRSTHAQHVVLPLQYLDACSSNIQWRNITGKPESFLLPIRTHLLSHLDDPLQVLRRYVLPHAQAGDIIAIGETPLAIMQGRFRHPRTVRPGLVAGLACRLFHPTSSLATACGMQALVDISGRLRVVLAVLIAVIARLLGRRGVFYQVAGEQARLIDDVTGTLPPYDQFITLGPVRVQATVDALKTKTGFNYHRHNRCLVEGCEVAIVDVNDLRRVQILAASHGVDHQFLEAALLDNPAGNADEQTPIVLIRKSDSRS